MLLDRLVTGSEVTSRLLPIMLRVCKQRQEEERVAMSMVFKAPLRRRSAPLRLHALKTMAMSYLWDERISEIGSNLFIYFPAITICLVILMVVSPPKRKKSILKLELVEVGQLES